MMACREICEKEFCTTRDELTIRGLYFKPEGEHLPIAVVSHRIMANYDTTRKYAVWFAERGYAAFCFDFNGGCVNSRSDNDTTKMTVFTEVEDLKAVLSYAGSLPETDPSNILLMGCSQGGVVSALTAVDMADTVQTLILFYPGLCMPEDARAGKMLNATFDPDNIPDIIPFGNMKLGGAYASSVKDMDMIETISRFEKPVLIVHGTGDRLVDYHYAERAAKAYPNATLKLIPDGTHVFSEEDDNTALLYVDEFLKSI